MKKKNNVIVQEMADLFPQDLVFINYHDKTIIII